MTFICSKTDDISLEEAPNSLGLDDEMAPAWAELDQLAKKQRSMKKQFEELKESKTVYDEIMNDTDEQIDIWVCVFPYQTLSPMPICACSNILGRRSV